MKRAVGYIDSDIGFHLTREEARVSEMLILGNQINQFAERVAVPLIGGMTPPEKEKYIKDARKLEDCISDLKNLLRENNRAQLGRSEAMEKKDIIRYKDLITQQE